VIIFYVVSVSVAVIRWSFLGVALIIAARPSVRLSVRPDPPIFSKQ